MADGASPSRRGRLQRLTLVLVGLVLAFELGGCAGSMNNGSSRVSTATPRIYRLTPGTQLVEFDNSPFPYDGNVPATGQPFMNVNENGRRGHSSGRGTYWQDETYNDRRVLISIPKTFDPNRPAVMVVYLHGNNATLARDVASRQGIPRQIASSGINAVLVAPQFAVDARDSSAGRFWEPGFFRDFLAEASERLAQSTGNPQLRGTFDAMPVVLVAYSGGYSPAAAALTSGNANGRIAGVALFDALYGEEDAFAAWVAQRGSAFFLSSYSASSKSLNVALQERLKTQGVGFDTSLPNHLDPGSVTFIDAGNVEHNDFMTNAWGPEPLRQMLVRIGEAPGS